MSCPTCDHTMQRVTHQSVDPIFWCPRCGTLIDRHSRLYDQPKLVGRVLAFAANLTEEHQALIDEFERLGIRESITHCDMGSGA